MITRKAGPALAAGCTMVIKPSELTPYSALALCVLAERAGLPAGIISVVTGDAKPIGGEFTSNPLVRKLSFTGSTPVGKLLMSQCAGTVKKISLELGGNAPFIVFDDADLEAAANGAIDHVKSWLRGTPAGDWTSAAVVSGGEYGVPAGLVFGYPVTGDGSARLAVVGGLALDAFGQEKFKLTLNELLEEQEAVKHLLPG